MGCSGLVALQPSGRSHPHQCRATSLFSFFCEVFYDSFQGIPKAPTWIVTTVVASIIADMMLPCFYYESYTPQIDRKMILKTLPGLWDILQGPNFKAHRTTALRHTKGRPRKVGLVSGTTWRTKSPKRRGHYTPYVDHY